jgi:serine/threonine-protein phosphatase 2A regulatory subunit B'
MKPSKTKTTKTSSTAGTTKSGSTNTSSVPGNRAPGSSSTKNTKESFQKKLVLCQKTFDYKDEQKDVKGKTERLNAINEIQQMLQDQKTVVSLIIPHLDDVMTMIEKNIFRPLPNVKKSNLQFSETGVE